MSLPAQTAALLKATRQLLDELSADAVLLLTETDLDWAEVFEILPAEKLLVSAKDAELAAHLQAVPNLRVLDIDPGPTPTHEQMSVALLEAVATDKLKPGAQVDRPLQRHRRRRRTAPSTSIA